jgi:hypothetical protein
MPNISRTEQERRGRAIMNAEYSDPQRTEDWLRTWLPRVDANYTVNDQVCHALAGLRGAVTLRDSANQLTSEYVALCRERGSSWSEIAQALRMTRQGAQRRYGAT